MTRPYIPFFAFLVLLLLTIPFSFDFATSVVPGWHTTIYPLYFAATSVLIIVLMLMTIGYWLLLKKADKINWTLFITHFLLTISTAVFIKFPSIFLDVQSTNEEQLLRIISFRIKLIPMAHWTFVVGQILFFIYFTRIIKAKRPKM